MAAMRYRCKACGNLTRFYVTRTTRTRSFYHFGLSGDLISVEEEEVLAEEPKVATCIWCSNGGEIEEIEIPLQPAAST